MRKFPVEVKLTVVPRHLTRRRLPPAAIATPFESLAKSFFSRATSTTVSVESALTTLTPTPCRPPEVE
jgi:hypothetical protein